MSFTIFYPKLNFVFSTMHIMQYTGTLVSFCPHPYHLHSLSRRYVPKRKMGSSYNPAFPLGFVGFAKLSGNSMEISPDPSLLREYWCLCLFSLRHSSNKYLPGNTFSLKAIVFYNKMILCLLANVKARLCFMCNFCCDFVLVFFWNKIYITIAQLILLGNVNYTMYTHFF